MSRSLIIVLTVAFVDALGVGVIVPILPDIILGLANHNVEIAAWYVGLVASAYAGMQLVCAPLVGRLSDKFGRRPILTASMFALALDFLFQALATSISMLFIGRIIAGMAGASVATANAYVADMSAPEDRVKNFGLVGAVYGLGLVAGPAAGAGLGIFHLRLPLLVLAGLCLCVAIWMAYEQMLCSHSSLIDDSASPVRRFSPFQTTYLSYFIAAVLCSSLAQRGLENLFVLHTEQRYAWSRTQAGLSLCLLGVMAIIAQGILARPVVSRFGAPITVLMALGILALTMLGFSMNTNGYFTYVLLVTGALSGIAGPALQSFLAERIDRHYQGQLQGTFVSVVSASSLIAPLFFTSMIFRYTWDQNGKIINPGTPFLVGACCVVLSILFAYRGFRSAPENVSTGLSIG